MSQLQDKLDEINRQKQLKILPENIREDIEIFGITGQMTTENMWQPIRAQEGGYYLLSFVNPDGNFDVTNILGYDNYRIVKFRNDNQWYLYDTVMDKPKLVTSTVPTDVCGLFGYTETDVFLRCTTSIKSYNLQSKEWTTRNTGLASLSTDIYSQAYYRNFYVNSYFGWNQSQTGILHYNPSTYTTSRAISATGSTVGLVRQFSDYVMCSNGISTATYVYKISSGTSKTILSSSALLIPTYNFDKVILANGIYNYDFSTNTIGAKLSNATISNASDIAFIWWVNNKYLGIVIYEGSGYKTKLYEFSDTNNTLTLLVNAPYVGSPADHYVTYIVGYTFMNNDYYFNTGIPQSSSNILTGHTFRDQYNQVVQGTMPNNGQLSYTPTKTSQTIPAGYTSGGVISAVTSAIDSNIKPENIKYGVEILGVAGVIEQDAAESVMTQEEYDTCLALANSILGV